MTEDDVRGLVKDWLGERSLRDAAETIGLSACYLSQQLTGQRPIGLRLQELVGVHSVRRFEKVACNPENGGA